MKLLKDKLPCAGTMSLTWARRDLPFETCFEYWRGPHGQLVGHNTSIDMYRQLHFEREDPLLVVPEWSVKQEREAEWIPDGIAECFCTNLVKGALSQKTKVAQLTFKDEQNAFERTILYTAMPGSAHRCVRKLNDYAMNGVAEGSRVVIMLSRGNASEKQFNKFFSRELVPLLASFDAVKELHAYSFGPYDENSWPGENIMHDQPKECEYAAGIVVGAGTAEELINVLKNKKLVACISRNAGMLSNVNVFKIRFTYVMREGNRATIASVRGAQVCDVLMATNAQNQVSDEFINAFFKRV